MGLPLYGHWQDMDQAGGEYLNYAKQQMGLAAPEYFLPPGVAYDRCMTYGGCSDDLLERVYNTSATMRAVYLRVDRVSSALQRYAVQMTGPTWSPASMTMAPESICPLDTPYDHFVYLPLVQAYVPPLPPDDTTGCSPRGGCGWFALDGRMVDYIPAP